ncbi:MAG: cytochrome c biogenesis protein CcsA [Deltaproteobacteria bacterium]|nr:cytochrome c biogenesis protein CcsA [Deltaproteobacteria bacterium]
MVDVSQGLFVGTCVTYGVAESLYLGTLAAKWNVVKRLATIAAAIGLTLHSSWLLYRWYVTGTTEFNARVAVGDVPTGLAKLYVYISHPPYTNLYESLIFVSWALMVFYLVIEAKWKIRPIGIGAVGVTLLALFEAYIVTEKDARALVPALQSYWILIHVWFLFLSYSLFMIAAFAALMFLIKVGAHSAAMGKWLSLAAAAVLALTGGGDLFLHGRFGLTPSAWMGGAWKPVHYFPEGAQKATKLFVTVPGAGPLLLVAIAILIIAAIVFHLDARGDDVGLKGRGIKVFLGAGGALGLALALVLVKALGHAPAALPEQLGGQVAQGVDTSSMIFHTNSNYGLGLVTLIFVLLVGFVGLLGSREKLSLALPEPKLLDDVTYKVIVAGFPLLSIGIVLGAMWAYEAWGRYWGWDPKETWALITWFVYAIYLHTRITLGWTGKPGAALAVSGFAVVIFCYMGVNLGLTGEGLHTYGAG